MEVKAEVISIAKLSDYFFVVPDYQREYVWKADDEVEQFLQDIDNEADSGQSYFIGSIIIVKNNKGKYDVIDGQQRLTTIILALCAIRDLLLEVELSPVQEKVLTKIKSLLFEFDLETGEDNVRLELQYPESKDYLNNLIANKDFQDNSTPSIAKMQDAYSTIKNFYSEKMRNIGVDRTIEDVRYFLTKVEIVKILSENLSSALKIFETINQRGAGLNAMDLIKNLLFSNVNESQFDRIKEIWKSISKNLQECGEENTPMRFLRYFFIARYTTGTEILREDAIYKWLISPEGKGATSYETRPIEFAKELSALSERYSRLVCATEKYDSNYPHISNIGMINKVKSRQHLILLLALNQKCDPNVIEYLAQQIESFFFYTVSMHIQAKSNESQFARWAQKLRNKQSIADIASILEETMLPYLKERIGDFKTAFMNIRHDQYNPLYRQRYILGKIENTMAGKCNLPLNDNYSDYQIEHILPQTPQDKNYIGFEDETAYYTQVYKLGNVTLIEGTINQAVNRCNDLSANWFEEKQREYCKSNMVMTQLLDHRFTIGTNTALNKFKSTTGYNFSEWNSNSIIKRQNILLDLALDSWKINGKRIDE